ncbi:hypothetical protein ACFO1B_54955 [Dactylosporangium siamense]|uniref:HSP18 transcriptional regulator n=1 Tax=Dactylosporangium siamense TaxID=685454 RepID=A0A919PZV7_9ACTN|nr:type III effector protein [Dactylosporangium siamense]GIG51618.1 hypothetical protein Dsi01nite_096590 [Dactylosporangium siamense]
MAGRDALSTAVAAITAVAERCADDGTAVDADAVLEALVLLRSVQEQLAAIEPDLIAAARRAGVSWQTLAPALGVASRQAAERRYLRAAPTAGNGAGTREDRVRAERDHRAGVRAVAQWTADNTADLRSLAGQVAALRNAPAGATADLDRLHRALADPDATALPALLVAVRQHLGGHSALAQRIDQVTASTDEVLRHTQQRRDRQ